MKEEKNIEQAIREKLEQFSVEPPAHVWSEIQAGINGQRRKKRKLYFTWAAAAAVVVFAFIAGWMFNENMGKVETKLVEDMSSHRNPAQSPALSETRQQKLPAADQVHAPVVSTEKMPIKKTNAVSKPVQVEENRLRKEFTAVNSHNRFRLRPMVSRSYVGSEIDIPNLHVSTTKRNDNQPGLLENDRLLMAENARRIAKNKHQADGENWVVGAYVSPGYAAHRSSYSNEYAQNLDQVSEGGVGNMGGGFSVQYKSGKRLRIESGVYYAQNSQSDGSTNRLLAFAPSLNTSNSAVSQPESNELYASSVQVQGGRLEVNSTAGTVRLRSAPDNAEISTLTNENAKGVNATLIANGELSQEFDFVEIPFYLRYKIIDRKYGIDVLGGLNAGLVVGNNAYLESTSGKQNVGQTANISTFNLSGTIGIGASYRLGNHFSLALEPRLNYYLNSINSSDEVSYKPYRIALFTGVYYEF